MWMKPMVCANGGRVHLSVSDGMTSFSVYLLLDSMMDDDLYDSKSNDYSTPASLMPLSSNNMKVRMTCLALALTELLIFLVRSSR